MPKIPKSRKLVRAEENLAQQALQFDKINDELVVWGGDVDKQLNKLFKAAHRYHVAYMEDCKGKNK